jgi:hypothetical protein
MKGLGPQHQYWAHEEKDEPKESCALSACAPHCCSRTKLSLQAQKVPTPPTPPLTPPPGEKHHISEWLAPSWAGFPNS